jgi:hypothetical protein
MRTNERNQIRLLRRGPNGSVLVTTFPLPAQGSPDSRGARLGSGAAKAGFYRQLRDAETGWLYETGQDGEAAR